MSYHYLSQRELLKKAQKLEDQASEIRALASGMFYVGSELYARISDEKITVVGSPLPYDEWPRFARWVKKVHDANITGKPSVQPYEPGGVDDRSPTEADDDWEEEDPS